MGDKPIGGAEEVFFPLTENGPRRRPGSVLTGPLDEALQLRRRAAIHGPEGHGEARGASGRRVAHHVALEADEDPCQ